MIQPLARNLRYPGYDRRNADLSEFNTMTDPHASTRQDNLFGICNAIGEDLGVNPLWPRLVFASAFMFDPVLVIASYFVLGAFVLLARIMFPRSPRHRETAEVIAMPPARAEEPAELARAA